MAEFIMQWARSLEGGSQCSSIGMTLVYASLVVIDGSIAITSAIQLVRFYAQNQTAGWTRQKVFHCMIGVSNCGFTVYFILDAIAACQGWTCWPNVCGFLAAAAPQIMFLATFLLLLSFWVDLCRQATDQDEEEDDDEENIFQYSKLPSFIPSGANDKHRKWFVSFKRWRVHGRQKIVVLVVTIITAVTAAFGLLISYGTRDNFMNSEAVAEVYADLFAISVFLCGVGLAAYGLLLYSKMCKVKTGKTSTDMRKVAGLAAAAAICFSLRALIVLCGNILVMNGWQWQHFGSQHFPVLIFLYYVIGEAIPSIVVLWVMRELPPRSRDSTLKGDSNIYQGGSSEDGYLPQPLIPNPSLLPHWTVPVDSQPYLVIPARSSSDIPIQKHETTPAPNPAAKIAYEVGSAYNGTTCLIIIQDISCPDLCKLLEVFLNPSSDL